MRFNYLQKKFEQAYLDNFKKSRGEKVYKLAYTDVCDGETTPPYVMSDKDTQLSPQADAATMLERVLLNLMLQWRHGNDKISLFSWLAIVAPRLSFLVRTDKAGDFKARHILVLLLYLSKMEAVDFAKLWDEFSAELSLWVGRAADGQCELRFGMTQGATISSFAASNGLPRWLPDILLHRKISEAYCAAISRLDTQPKVCDIRTEDSLATVRRMKIYEVTSFETGREIGLRGWCTFDGVCLVTNNFPADIHSRDAQIKSAVSAYILQITVHETPHHVFRDFTKNLDVSSPFSYAIRDGSVLPLGMPPRLDKARLLTVPISQSEYKDVNFELGLAAEQAVLGVKVDYVRALKGDFELLDKIVLALAAWSHAANACLPLFSIALQTEIKDEKCADYEEICCFGMYRKRIAKKRVI